MAASSTQAPQTKIEKQDVSVDRPKDIYDTDLDDPNYEEIVKRYIQNLSGDSIPRQHDWISPDSNQYGCCLFMIVKNEGKNMRRCLDAVKDAIDCFCICDTGSTDDCVEVMRGWAAENEMPHRIYTATSDGSYRDTDWRSFGFNRTQSAIFAHLSFPNAQYLMTIDADMVFRIDNSVDWSSLTADSFKLLQKNSSITYPNMRVLSNKLDWSNVCYTHEYWQSPGNLDSRDLPDLWIDDRGDGGCKNDKFHRDIYLLHMQIEDYPEDDKRHVRGWFYAAESHRNINDRDMAICLYHKRYKLGDWDEERWYSLFKMAECFLHKTKYIRCDYHPTDDYMRRWRFMSKYRGYQHYPLNWQAGEENTFRPFADLVDPDFLEKMSNLDPKNAGIKYMLKAHNLRPHRAEPLVALATFYREKKDQQALGKLYAQAAAKCNPGNDGLFVSRGDHSYQPYYETAICAYHTGDYGDGINAANRFLEFDRTQYAIGSVMVQQTIANMGFYWKKMLEFAEHYRNNNQHRECYNHAKWALEVVKHPEVAMTIDDQYRAWFEINVAAYYIGEYREGYQAGEKAKELNPPDTVATIIESNKAYYRKHVATGIAEHSQQNNRQTRRNGKTKRGRNRRRNRGSNRRR